MSKDSGFFGNPNLKPMGVTIEWTDDLREEYEKCYIDPVYFAEKYIKIVHPTKGLIPIKLFDYQKELVEVFQNHDRIVLTTARQMGKCVVFDTIVKVRNKTTKKVEEITIGELYKRANAHRTLSNLPVIETEEISVLEFCQEYSPSKTVKRKFVDSIDLNEYEIWTDSGWEEVTHIHKTVEYQEYELTLENGVNLICADDHIVFVNGQEVFVKDLELGDLVNTENGLVSVKKVVKTDRLSNMYDVTVPNGNKFYSNGILSHNTTVAVVVILWYILFNQHKSVALLSNKASSAIEIMSRIQLAYESLPFWLQQGVTSWAKGSFSLENGCKVFASASSSSAIRGRAISLLYIDEAAFIPNWEEFRDSVLPTISAGSTGEDDEEKSKLIYTSTPNGLNHYYYTWDAALKGKNDFYPIAADWTKHPDRDEKWKQKTLADMNFDEMKFAQEYCLEFVGSSGTLISGAALKSLEPEIPIRKTEDINQYENVVKGGTYILVADVGEGKGLDYSAFSIFDVTTMPYKQVLTFRSNQIGVVDYASTIYEMANIYNQAYVLVEVNSIGSQVSDTLLLDYGYENIMMTKSAGNSGKRISSGFGGGKVDKGVRTTKTVKASGCSMLKNLIEQKQLVVTDHQTIQELNTFSRKGQSYEAEAGHHDDMVMPLVLFGWLSTDPFFKEITNIDTLNNLREMTQEEMLEQVIPFGFIQDGVSDNNYNLDNLV